MSAKNGNDSIDKGEYRYPTDGRFRMMDDDGGDGERGSLPAASSCLCEGESNEAFRGHEKPCTIRHSIVASVLIVLLGKESAAGLLAAGCVGRAIDRNTEQTILRLYHTSNSRTLPVVTTDQGTWAPRRDRL